MPLVGGVTLGTLQQTYEKDTVTIFGSFTVGASGAVGTVQGLGVSGVAKVAATTGQYEITFANKFFKLLDYDFKIMHASLTAVAQIQALETPATVQVDIKADQKFKLACSDFAGAAVDPEENSAIFFKAVFRVTSVNR